jgi:ligand-binding SRPBCC domain-containing protein
MGKPRHHYVTADWVSRPVEQVFAFFARPANLPRLLPGWQQARIDYLRLAPAPSGSGPGLSGAAGEGSEILLSFLPVPLAPVRLHWLAVIDEFVPNSHFCDLQRSGPFAYWRHCHRVEAETRNGRPGTRITDEVHYALPLGPLDPLANAAFMRWQLAAIFAVRKRKLRRCLPSD